MAKPIKKPRVSNQSAAVANEMQKQWNVLIYMAADNSLKEECLWALTEILRAGSIPAVDVTAQFDSGADINRFDFRKLRRNAKLNYGGSSGGVGNSSSKASFKLASLADEITQNFTSRQDNGHRDEAFKGQVIESDAEMIKNFIQTATEQTKSLLGVKSRPKRGLTADESEVKPYNMIVLSGHGSGAVGDFLTTDNPPSALSIPGLGSIFDSAVKKLGRPIDVLGMDSCLMSMAEVCYQLRNTVKFSVGSEGFELNTGWPYHNILAALQAKPRMKPDELACTIVKEYVHYYSDYTLAGVSVDYAACDLSQSDGLREAVMKLAQVLQDKLADIEDAILLAHWRAQSYKFEQYVDLWDFCDLLEKGCNDTEVKEACRGAKAAIEKFVLISCYSGAAFQHSHGLSVYFPWAKSDLDNDLPHYKELDFHKDTNWGAFLEAYGKKTQRELRGNSGKANYKSGKRERLAMPPRNGTEANLRTNPAIGERGVDQRVVRVKNPPDHFYKYEDDCAGQCGRR